MTEGGLRTTNTTFDGGASLTRPCIVTKGALDIIATGLLCCCQDLNFHNDVANVLRVFQKAAAVD